MFGHSTMRPHEYKKISAEVVRPIEGINEFKDHPIYLHFENEFSSEVKYLTAHEAQRLLTSLIFAIDKFNSLELPENL